MRRAIHTSTACGISHATSTGRNTAGFQRFTSLTKFVGFQTRCLDCNAKLLPPQPACQSCGSSNFRTIEERVRGWVGIQRFDDATNFGINLIRNGRSIRIAERTAFFEYVDEFKKTVKDYPIDSPFGRIVGEVHLNHVPVDYLKQDFQRNSEEWQRVIAFLRGESSLQPTQPNADANDSPIFKLYQGYRRIRKVGKADMYMGYWDPRTISPSASAGMLNASITRSFESRLPGYYDDAQWWKLVELADQKPLEELVRCPSCQADNLKNAELCQVCDYVLSGKACLESSCGQTIAKSAVVCPYCGASQVLEIREPWRCQVCTGTNRSDDEACAQCGALRGTPSPASRDYLFACADKDDGLSFTGYSVHSQTARIASLLTWPPMSCAARSRRHGKGHPCRSFPSRRIFSRSTWTRAIRYFVPIA